MSIKEQIAQELETLSEPLLQEVLDFVQFVQAKHQKIKPVTAEHTLTGSTAEDLLEFVGSWEGEDIRECLELVHENRMPLEF